MSASNKIPKNSKQPYAPPRPMRYCPMQDIHQQNFDRPDESTNYSYNVLPKKMNFTKTTDKYIPDSINTVAKANIEIEYIINKFNNDGSTTIDNNN